MGRVYKIAVLPQEIVVRIDEKLHAVLIKPHTPELLIDTMAFLHWVAAVTDPYYSGSEARTISERVFDLEDIKESDRLDRARELLEELLEYRRVKMVDITKDHRCTAPREAEGVYQTVFLEDTDTLALHRCVQKFLPLLQEEQITHDHLRKVGRAAILLECTEPQYTGNCSAREDGVSACERFVHAVHYISNTREALLRAITVLYTAAKYQIVRVRAGKSIGFVCSSRSSKLRISVKQKGGNVK